MRYLLILVVLLVACDLNIDNNETENNEVENVAENSEENNNLTNNEVEEIEPEPIDKTIEINEELKFENFHVEFEKAKLYEDDGVYIDLLFSWRNLANELGDTTLYVVTMFEVVQGEELTDINDYWNPSSDKGLDNDVFLKNTISGLSPVKLTYELDSLDDVEVKFTPTTETEDTQTITIELE